MTSNSQNSQKNAVLYRMEMPAHTCPYGLKAKALLKSEGYEIDDQKLTTKEHIDAFKAREDVKTTPQTYIDGKRIGGYEDLRKYLGKPVADPKVPSYKPIAALLLTTALMSIAVSYSVFGSILKIEALQWFIAFSMTVLALLKLQNLESFSTMFLNYDLLAKKWVAYSYVYPFAEGIAGILMISGLFPLVSSPISIIIGLVGGISVLKAVYIDRRELKCACVGGSSNVPLGFVSLMENVMM
ncbi:MAG: glutaredoxin, partial [Proteobacteria bacterium]